MNDDDPGNPGDPGEMVKIQFESNLKLNGNLTDVWGYVDPDSGREYALLGFNTGVHIVDVSDAQNPALTATVGGIPGFDVKVWQNYMYTVTGGGGTGAIVDLSAITNPSVVGSFSSSHNIFISDQGYMFLESPGLRIMDLNENPVQPKLIWTGGAEGHDATVVDDRLYDFHGSRGTNIYDISDITSPVLLGTITSPLIRYHHSGWPTVDGNYLLICDEGARHPANDITMWDIHDPGNPEMVDAFKDSTAIVHNLYIIDDLALTAYYNDGFKLFDTSEPGKLKLLDEYDTSNFNGEFFSGAFGVYPFAPSGYIYLSDIQEGLFLFSLQSTSSSSKRVLF